jgi:hypothetical protein
MIPNWLLMGAAAAVVVASAPPAGAQTETQAQAARISAWSAHTDWDLAQTSLISVKTQLDTDYATFVLWYDANKASWNPVKLQAIDACYAAAGAARSSALSCRNQSATFGASGDTKYVTGDYYFYTEHHWPAAIMWYGQASSSWSSGTNKSLQGLAYCDEGFDAIAIAYSVP